MPLEKKRCYTEASYNRTARAQTGKKMSEETKALLKAAREFKRKQVGYVVPIKEERRKAANIKAKAR